MQETIEQFKNLSRKDQKEVLNLIKLKNDFKKQETKRKVKRYDVVVEYLKRQIKLCNSDIKEFEDKNCENVSENLKIYIKVYKEILNLMEEGKK